MLKGWQEHGECARLAAKNPKLLDKVFFPRKGRPANNPEFHKYCGVCEVAEICLSYAIVHDLDGVWGNTTHAQRELLLKIRPNLVEQMRQQAINDGWFELPPISHPVHLPETVQDPDYLLSDDLPDPDTQLLCEEDFLLHYEWVEYQRTIEHIEEVYEEPPEGLSEEVPLPIVLPQI